MKVKYKGEEKAIADKVIRVSEVLHILNSSENLSDFTDKFMQYVDKI